MACSKSETKPVDIEKPAEEDQENPAEDDKIPTTNYGIIQLGFLEGFNTQPIEKIFAQQRIRELSGLAGSHKYPGVLYMHGDSKNSPILITNHQGEALGEIILDGFSTVDPEDISVGPGPQDGKSYIYFADIGDNDRKRSSITIYRFEEPSIDLLKANSAYKISAKDVSKLQMTYPKEKFNAESLLVDPLTKDVFIITKETYKAKVFRAAYPQKENTVLTQVLNMQSFDLFTAAAISFDGSEILIRNKSQIWYWKRDAKQSVVEALLHAPLKAPYVGNEHQGEGISFSADAQGYFTNSEVKDWPELQSKLSFYQHN